MTKSSGMHIPIWIEREGRKSPWTSIEIHGVRSFEDGMYCEVDDLEPESYSVYLRNFEGFCSCVDDFTSPASAREFAKKLQEKLNLIMEDYLHQKTKLESARVRLRHWTQS